MSYSRSLIGALVVLGFIVQPAGADQSYKGKTIQLVVPESVGSFTDRYNRIAARHMLKHIPGTTGIVVRNMPGASGMVAANWLYKFARPDGLTMGAIHRTMPLKKALGVKQARFEPAKFNWIGTPVQGTAVCIVRADKQYKTAEALVNAKKPVKMAATRRQSDSFVVPLMLNKVMGANMMVISTLVGGRTAALALNKGETDGFCTSRHRELSTFEKNAIRVLVQIGRKKHPELEDVPLATEFVKDDKKDILEVYNKQLSVGLPWVMPPGVPKDRVETMRKVFRDVTSDPEFRAEAKKAGIQINPLTGNELQLLVESILKIPPSTKLPVKDLFGY